MGVCSHHLPCLWKNVVDSVEDDVLVLLVPVEVIQLPHIHRQQYGLAFRMVLHPHGKGTGGFMTPDILWRAWTSRREDREPGVVGFVEIVQTQVKLPEQQRLQFKPLEHGLV